MAGHAFVSFVYRNNLNKQTIVDETWGFHPVKQGIMSALWTEGKMESDAGIKDGKPEPQSILGVDYDFVVEVDDETYEVCKSVKEIWKAKNYSVAAKQTCVQFAADVASKIPGITIPANFSDRWPKDFLLDLRDQNLRRDHAARVSLTSIPSPVNPAPETGSPMTGSFIAPDGTIRFSYPASWALSDYKTEWTLASLDHQSNGGDHTYQISLNIDSLDDEEYRHFNIDAYQQRITQDAARSPNGAKMLVSRTQNAGAYPGLYFEYTVNAMAGGSRYIRWDVFVKRRKISFQYHQIPSSEEGPIRQTAIDILSSLTVTSTSGTQPSLPPAPAAPSPLPKRPAGQPLIGGATAEELGKLLLRSLQKNDKKLWMSCIHPDIGYTAPYAIPGILDNYAKQFDRTRQYFEEHGLSHWENTSFRIASFDYGDNGNALLNYQVEFYYQGKSFLCALSSMRAVKYKNKFYLIQVPITYGFVPNKNAR